MGFRQDGIGGEESLEIGRDQAGLMIVTMQVVHWHSHHSHEFKRRSLKENPALCLVRIIFAGDGIHVDPVAVKEAIVSNKEDLHLRLSMRCAMNVEAKLLDAQRNANVGQRYSLEAEPTEMDL